MVPSDSRVFSLSFSLLRLRSASSSIDTVSRPYGRTPTPPDKIPKANKRSNAKKHLFPILYLTHSPRRSSLPFFILYTLRGRFSRSRTRVLGVPVSRVYLRTDAARSRFYCCRKLMRSRDDTTDMAGRTIQALSWVSAFAFIKRCPFETRTIELHSNESINYSRNSV